MWQKTVLTILEPSIISVDESYRITIPKTFCNQVGWITQGEPHEAWLLVGGPGRCRLHSAAEVENEPSFRSLRERIAEELNIPNGSALEFQDPVSAALYLRLFAVQIMPRGPGWRLAVPRPIAAIMNISPKESDIAALLLQGHIELWTIEALRSALTAPLEQIIGRL